MRMHWGDERAICEETMSGGSLGQRTGSTGSLQWLQHQQHQQSVVISASPPLNLRKVGKGGVIPSARERLGVWICRMAGRRKAGMSLLVLVSLLVFISFLLTLNKDEDTLSMELRNGSPPRFYRSIVADRRVTVVHLGHHSSPLDSAKPGIAPKRDDPVEVNAPSFFLRADDRSKIQPPIVFMDPSLPPGHPCQQFTLPPPPADKKRTGPRPCPVCYLPVDQAIKLMPTAPFNSPILKNLTYVMEAASSLPTHGTAGSDFGGYPTLKQREDYFKIQKSMHVHCGFAKGSKPGNATGFDVDEKDLFDMEQCHGIVVASAIFGNYDEIQQPKNISEKAKMNICFFMFVDEETESFLRKTAALDNAKRIGLWRIVVVHHLPYSDARRNGKIPKLLLHRLFPNVRFSLWIDGKLELVVDPYQILERFLWRSNDTFAISQHYRRFDVFVEAEANKAAGKYDNASINAQVEFYRKEGLTPYSRSKLPITSDVPEGCVIIREHTPITNLFTCLWFNEVDRFTSRDQISFAIVRDKIIARVNWRINMFLDCERRNFVVQAYHRDILEQRSSMLLPPMPKLERSSMLLPPMPKLEPSKKLPVKVPEKVVKSSGRKGSSRHSKEKKSANGRQRKTKIGSKGAEFS